ncbi:uncharacterized protein LOC131669385 [Phymastichus coffea]|uniref:uncharacterized protein LOC131669385 n=1 Tax=Phymastichus coffea TaxID=108790 RepID=UPI00273CD2D3|nr:uncharacterized protein LOC131669385 [Phymastichus coffea]
MNYITNAIMIKAFLFILIIFYTHSTLADWSQSFVEERIINHESDQNENRYKLMVKAVGDTVKNSKSFCILTGLSRLKALKDPYRQKIEKCVEEAGEPSAAIDCSDQEESAVKDIMEDIVLEATTCVKQSE